MSESNKRKHVHHGQDSNQIDKNENKINKELTEIRHYKHKNYLQSKSVQRNKS